jgi:hypothetical protein
VDETLILGGAGERDWERIRFLSGSPAAEISEVLCLGPVYFSSFRSDFARVR